MHSERKNLKAVLKRQKFEFESNFQLLLEENKKLKKVIQDLTQNYKHQPQLERVFQENEQLRFLFFEK